MPEKKLKEIHLLEGKLVSFGENMSGGKGKGAEDSKQALC